MKTLVSKGMSFMQSSQAPAEKKALPSTIIALIGVACILVGGVLGGTLVQSQPAMFGLQKDDGSSAAAPVVMSAHPKAPVSPETPKEFVPEFGLREDGDVAVIYRNENGEPRDLWSTSDKVFADDVLLLLAKQKGMTEPAALGTWFDIGPDLKACADENGVVWGDLGGTPYIIGTGDKDWSPIIVTLLAAEAAKPGS